MEKNLKSENLSDSQKQTLCNKMEEQVEKLDVTRPEVRTGEFVDFSDIRSHYRDLIKLYRHSKDCGNQTSLVSSTSAGDKDSNETVNDTGNGAIENAEGKVEVSSRHSDTENNQASPTHGHREGDRSKKWSSTT